MNDGRKDAKPEVTQSLSYSVTRFGPVPLEVMQALDLPPFDAKLTQSATNQPLIWDELRRKHVVLTPEEWVRQHVVHYLNGAPASEHALTIKAPFRVGVAELGNWNAKGFPRNDPFMIRNFGGSMDEFCLFGRALGAAEIRALYSTGKPQPEPTTQTNERKHAGTME